MSTSEPVVSVDWFHANLREPDMKVLDASWYMLDEQRNPVQEYQVAHISGALFFDVDGISDHTANHIGDFNYPRLADFGATISGSNKLQCQQVLEELDAYKRLRTQS